MILEFILLTIKRNFSKWLPFINSYCSHVVVNIPLVVYSIKVYYTVNVLYTEKYHYGLKLKILRTEEGLYIFFKTCSYCNYMWEENFKVSIMCCTKKDMGFMLQRIIGRHYAKSGSLKYLWPGRPS